MTSDECFQSSTTTFKFKETWSFEDFSTHLIEIKPFINGKSVEYFFNLLYYQIKGDDTNAPSNNVALYLVVTFPLNVNHFQYTVFVDGQFSILDHNKGSRKSHKTGE